MKTKVCPRCGSYTDYNFYDIDKSGKIRCVNCGARIPVKNEKKEEVKK